MLPKIIIELKISRNVKIKYPFHFKTYFHVLDNFHTSCLSYFNALKNKNLKIRNKEKATSGRGFTKEKRLNEKWQMINKLL